MARFLVLGCFTARASWASESCDESILVQGVSQLRLQHDTIAGNLQLRQNSTATQFVTSMKDMVVTVNKLHKQGIDQTTLDAIDTAIGQTATLITDAIATLVTENGEAQSQLDIARDAALACLTSEQHGEDAVGALHSQLGTQRTSHVDCRTEEHTLSTARTTECDELTHLMEHQLPETSCAMPSRDDPVAIRGMLDALDTYVGNWRQQFIDTAAECETARAALVSKSEDCRTKQRDFEVTSCSHQAGCSVLTECWDRETGEFNAIVTSEQTALNTRQDHYRSLTQASCIIGLIRTSISENTIVGDDALEACGANIAIPNDLTLTFHQLTDPIVGCTDAAEQVCSAAFFSAEYGTFEEWQQAVVESECTACPGSGPPDNTPAALLSSTAQCPGCTCDINTPDPHWGCSGCHSLFDDVVQWGCNGLHMSQHGWVTLTFPEAVWVDHIDLFQLTGGHRKGAMDIDTMTDGAWTVQGSIAELPADQLPVDGHHVFRMSEPVTATQVRLRTGALAPGTDPNWRLLELQVHGWPMQTASDSDPCPDPAFPHPIADGRPFCYTDASYAAAHAGPCESWCTTDPTNQWMAENAHCGSALSKVCGGQ